MPRFRWVVPLFVGLCVLLLTSSFLCAQESAGLRVDEAAIRFRLTDRPMLELPIVNTSGEPAEGDLRLELLSTNGHLDEVVEEHFRAASGKAVQKIAWPLDFLVKTSPSWLGWERLRYQLILAKGSSIAPAKGIVQLSQVLVGTFQVRMTAASQAKPGSKYPVRVRVDDPSTGKPLRGTRIELNLQLGDDEEKAIRHTVTTDFSGYAVYSFDLPKDIEATEGTVSAEAKRGPYSDEVQLELDLPAKNKLTIATDKPLYQPGQAVHLRILAFGPDKRALAEKDIVVTIENEDEEEQFHETVKTSRFGIASADWQIPEKLRLGDYRVSAKTKTGADEDDYENPKAWATLRVSRYELPTFTVKADPDRKYYLPGQDAKIEMRADYLFGKPVQNAKVRLVKQESRRWDFKEQKWTSEESDPIEGALDENGKLMAKLNLQDEFAGFDPKDFSHYQDLTLAAYVTDLSTKRTEQRRFRIRLSAQPIQIYVVGGDNWSDESERPTLFVTSSYADGSPASVAGTLYFAEPNNLGKFEDEPWLSGHTKALTFHTNRYGLAKITLPRIRDRFLIKQEYRYSYYRFSQDDREIRNALLLLEGRDRNGLMGRGSQGWTVAAEGPYLRVKTTQTLYHPEEAIPLTIESNSSLRQVIVDVSTAAGMIASRVVYLQGGRAELTVDYDARLRGEVEITAFALASAEDGEDALSGTTHVIYPSLQDLSVGLKMANTTFRPGEQAEADFQVRSPEGRPVESALGVLVFDRAVAERVRSDEEFGRSYGFSLYDYWDPVFTGEIADINVHDLLGLNPNQPFSPDLQLLAEALMYGAQSSWWYGNVRIKGGENYKRGTEATFGTLLSNSLKPVREALSEYYSREGQYPKNDGELREFLDHSGIDLEGIVDPWGHPYRTEYSVRGTEDVLTFKSDGPDKKPRTRDDASAGTMTWAYFKHTGILIDEVVRQYQGRTGKYIRDYPTLRSTTKEKGVDLDTLVDPWGRKYRFAFETLTQNFRIVVTSAGPDGFFDSEQKSSWDDVQEWTSSIHYFQDETIDLERALAKHFERTKMFPQSDEELKPVLEAAKLMGDRLLDPWGHPYHFRFSKRSRYWDRMNVSTYYDYTAAKEQKKTEVTPVTQELGYIEVVSYGPQNQAGQAFEVAEFSRVLTEQSSKDLEKKANSTQGPLPSGSGAISGVVTDPSGAVIANATVNVTSQNGRSETAKTDERGRYLISGIPSGTYEVKVEAIGFQHSVVTHVPVQMGSTTALDLRLNLGGVSEVVEVQALTAVVNTDSASLAGVVPKGLQGTPAVKKPLFTPRLRKYFPETLLWKPEVITDKTGRAHIDFTMADTITAWSMSVIASTEAGEVGVSRKELRTFQPFFVEHDPPKVLTQGDQLSLPVVLRNYSDKPQTLVAELKPEAWFAMLSPGQQKVTVDAGHDTNAIFTFKATGMVSAGKQRVTARNTETGDAVEREVRVHPDGQEISFSNGRVLAGAKAVVNVEIPATAIAGSTTAELRLYPNLIAHVLDAMEGLGRKPVGCAEQITSTGYVNLQALQLLKKAGSDHFDAADPRAKIVAAARKSVQDGYALLPSLQKEDGAFSYWNFTSADVALSAYVLRFLNGAREFVDVDPAVITKARTYLTTRQMQSGAWPGYDWQTGKVYDDPRRTAYVARALATSMDGVDEKSRAAIETSIEKALAYLDDRIGDWSDPYLVGNYALAAIGAKHQAHIANARQILSRLAHDEGTTTYWNLEANTTPFYGWGSAGRLETTALAVEALAKLHRLNNDSAQDEQENRGLQYLLSHKDRYYTWFSTQATQNALEAMITAVPVSVAADGENTATVLVNGTTLTSVPLPRSTEVVGPRVIEFGRELAKGPNAIEIQRTGDTGALQASVITSYYVPWSESAATNGENLQAGDTRALKLKVNFDRREGKVGEAIKVRVEAERIGFRGYGMMIAEVGLPPGAEVDRESLESTRGNGADGYEVQPDRVVFYLWPSAGGTKFEFQFRPRYAIDALSTPSVLYDYYNPEANAVVTPVRIVVR